MAKTKDIKKALATAPKVVSLRDLVQKSAVELGKALPPHMGPERIVRIALTEMRRNPALELCTKESFLGSLFTLAQIGLEPVGGRAYLLPFVNSRKVNGEWKSVREVQAIIGYKGLVELFYRHTKAVELTWDVVHENDKFEWKKGTSAFLDHTHARGNRGPVEGYWVMAVLAGGGKPFHYMSAEDCMNHGARHSKTYDKKKDVFHKSSPWSTAPESMCLKTVMVQLMKILPLSVELQKAINKDETSTLYSRGTSPIDVESTTNWEDDTADDAPAAEKNGKTKPKAEAKKAPPAVEKNENDEPGDE